MTAVLMVWIVIFLVGLDALFLWRRRWERGFVSGVAPMSAFAPVGLPSGVFVHSSHSWVQPKASGELQVGLDELMAQALGGVDRVELPEVGTWTKRGSSLAAVWRGGRRMVVRAPVSGTVLRTNEALTHSAMPVTNDPYGAGWLVAVAPKDTNEAAEALRVGGAAVQWMKEEVQRFIDFMARRSSNGVVGAVLADGAHPMIGSAGELDDSDWNDFQREFVLRPSD